MCGHLKMIDQYSKPLFSSKIHDVLDLVCTQYMLSRFDPHRKLPIGIPSFLYNLME